ncbi:hypothetical protein E0K83_09545 [Gramella sp. BOM4]|nr:hypothetical protein [Christiangramia bathymodioli]
MELLRNLPLVTGLNLSFFYIEGKAGKYDKENDFPNEVAKAPFRKPIEVKNDDFGDLPEKYGRHNKGKIKNDLPHKKQNIKACSNTGL